MRVQTQLSSSYSAAVSVAHEPMNQAQALLSPKHQINQSWARTRKYLQKKRKVVVDPSWISA